MQQFDDQLQLIAAYLAKPVTSELAFSTARYCLMDALGCAILALHYPACKKLLGPIIPGTVVPEGARIPGTAFVLDPILAAFNLGTMIRWLDFNDTWLAAEWGHPSDNLGAILAVTDYLSRNKVPVTIKQVLTAMIQAYEIQGILALENGFNRLGYDHVILVKIASTAVATHLLGGTPQDIMSALSQAWLDGATLRTYRHAPNTGPRKSWAAGDATSRAVRLAWMTLQGEMGYPNVLSTHTWGFNDTILRGAALKIPRLLDAYVMEHILFKIAYPAEFHAQTAVEAAIKLHAQVNNRLADIDKIVLTTQESALRIINKTGTLSNPADRDHCLQYMVAVALLTGDLKADDYEDRFAQDTRIDQLRKKMLVQENKQFSIDYLDADKRSITNAVQVYFNDGSKTENIIIEYPLGHHRRRQEGIPLLLKKFQNNMRTLYAENKINDLLELFQDQTTLEKTLIHELVDMLVIS